MSKIIKASKVNRLLIDLGFLDVQIDKPFTKFKLEVFLKNLGLKQKEVKEIINGFD